MEQIPGDSVEHGQEWFGGREDGDLQRGASGQALEVEDAGHRVRVVGPCQPPIHREERDGRPGNADDRGDYRPGRTAARQFGVISPLDDADLSKTDIRLLSHEAGLPTWDEPASACLSSRIPYYSEVTEAKLRVIEDAEEAIRALGFRVLRVRHHGEVARVELGRDEMARAIEPDVAAAIDRALRALGFRYVTLDLKGYRLGSLNEGLSLRPV